MKKQILIQIKETLSSLHSNIKLHIISWLTDSLSDDVDSCIETIHFTFILPTHIVTVNMLSAGDIY
ncbi:MAG: hypothetical protein ACTS73_01720 [Arsenophonus sp. NEOnobi-MAG3]